MIKSYPTYETQGKHGVWGLQRDLKIFKSKVTHLGYSDRRK